MNPSLFLLFRDAYLTGWAVAAPIGPVNLEIMRRGLRHGAMAGLMVGTGACCVDGLYMLLFSLGVRAAAGTSPLMAGLYLVGGGLLAWLGWGALREALNLFRRRKDGAASLLGTGAEGERTSLLRCYLVGLGMTASNPLTIAFWSALSLQFAKLALGERLLATGAIMAGCFSWVVLINMLVAFARGWIGARLFSAVTFVGGTTILCYGLVFLGRGAMMIRHLVSG